MAKYTSNVLWLKPFIESISHLVPIDKLTRVKGYKVRKGFEEHQHGALHKYETGDIILTVKCEEYYKSIKDYKAGLIGNILETVAHELAHLKYWDHTPKHFKLQATILLIFGDVLEQLNIEDTSSSYE